MNLNLKKLKEFWNRLLKKKIKQQEKPKSYQLGRDDLDDKELQNYIKKDKARLEAKLSAEKTKNFIARKELDDTKKVNIKKILNEQSEQLRKQPYIGSFSLRIFFKDLERIKRNSKRKPILVVSYDDSKVLGKFQDLIILQDGRFCLLTEDGPLLSARTLKDMFRNYKGIADSASRGFLKVNLDNKRKYMENVLEKEVPHMIIDGEGKTLFKSKISNDTFANQLADVNEELQEVMSELEVREKAFIGERSEKLKAEQKSKVDSTRAEVSETELKKSLTNINQIQRKYKSIVEENEEHSSENRILNKKLNDYEDRFDNIRGKLTELLGSDSKSIAETDIKSLINWISKKKLDNLPPLVIKTSEKAEPKEPEPNPESEEEE